METTQRTRSLVLRFATVYVLVRSFEVHLGAPFRRRVLQSDNDPNHAVAALLFHTSYFCYSVAYSTWGRQVESLDSTEIGS